MSPKPNIQRKLVYRGFRLLTTLEEGTAKSLLDSIAEKSYEVQKIFKDSSATYAAQILVGNESIIYKIPRARLRRFGERLATLFRNSESVRTFKNLQFMHQLGFLAPIPLMAGQKRRWGLVVDSFCCYRFHKGTAAGPQDAELVATELLNLHKKGYLRSDAKPANFLISEKGVTFIDFRLKKPRILPKLQKEMELAHLARIYPECLEFIPEDVLKSPSFALAAWFERKGIEFRRVRRGLRRIFKSTKA
jgi:heptose II phosphotransferase